jgi:hypothetical protein
MPARAAEPARPDDEAKRRFREALDRKRGRQAGTPGSPEGRDPSGIHGTHGPESHQKSFRRKSG